MSEFPTYPPPPPLPPGGRPPVQQKQRINWVGYILGAIFGPPVVGGIGTGLTALLGAAFGDGARSIGGVLTLGLLVGVPIALCVPDRTRPWGVGMFIGFALWLVIAAGACVVLLAVLVHGESSSP
jgi:hypothetical protein